MIDTVIEAAEILRNYFAESPLGKQLEDVVIDNIGNIDDSSLADYINDGPDELCDDNGKQYLTEDGELVPNNDYVLNEVAYKTDDNGNIYIIDGKFQSDTTYELNGNIYTTDTNGRIVGCEASLCVVRRTLVITKRSGSQGANTVAPTTKADILSAVI